MGSKKKVESGAVSIGVTTSAQAELTVLPNGDGHRPPLQAELGPVREYTAAGELMRVGRFDFLTVEFTGLQESDLPKFHETLAIHTRGWMILRRLFGICPVLPKRGTEQDDLRTWPREELIEALGITTAQLREEIDRLRGVWSGLNSAQSKTAKTAAPEELLFQTDVLVKRYGMESLLTREEFPWMAGRLEAVSVIINHPQVGEMMRNALLTELELRRLHLRLAQISREMVDTGIDRVRRAALMDEYDWAFKKRSTLAGNYQGEIEQLDKVFPFLKQSAGSITMRAVFSDAVACHADWYRDGTNRPVDGVYSVGEVEVLMRMSVQAPEPQYRAGQVVYLNQARAFLFDPKWSGAFLPMTLKKLDAGFKAAAEDISKADGETLTDLTSDDPIKGEYPTIAGKV